jgi:hypothetical protein
MVQDRIVTQTGSPALRRRLPRGAVAEIAQSLGLSWAWTHKVISGRIPGDPRIVQMALEMARIEDQRREKLADMVERNRKELEMIS